MEQLLTGRVARLRHVQRFSAVPVIRPENVAEHSFFVAFYAYAIAKDLDLGHIDLSMVLSRAIVHDVEECVSGDFVRTFKYSAPEVTEALSNAATLAAGSLFENLFPRKTTGRSAFFDWQSAKQGGVQGLIVSYADFLSVLSYLWHERKAGNRHAVDERSTLEAYYHSFFDKFKQGWPFEHKFQEYHKAIRPLLDEVLT